MANTDKQRLDWLNLAGSKTTKVGDFRVNNNKFGHNGWFVIEKVEELKWDFISKPYPTIRMAIDAAMKLDRKAKAKK